MKLIADVTVPLPFALDFCARGPDVEPLQYRLNEMDVTLYFPPSIGEGTDGKGIFGDWAWWTGTHLRLLLSWDVDELEDVEAHRAAAVETINETLRRFLNLYRWRFERPDIYPVRVEAGEVLLESIDDDGARHALVEPIPSFFYNRLPSEPPLATSVSAQTLPQLQSDLDTGTVPPLADQLRLDTRWLEALGEKERAAAVRRLSEE